MKQDTLRVVITGASSGIGAATAIAFARQGAHLVLGARGREGLEDIAGRCRQAGGQAQVQLVDVTDAAAVAAFAADARDTLGGIDLWFSDVGIGVVGRYLDVPMTDHRHVVETNLVSHMNEAHAVLPVFVAQGHGIWVNMISLGGYMTSPYAAAYAASKFGLRGFSAALRGEMHDHPRIHICDVYPTFVDTPAIYHAGNYTGARLTYPPGALAPEKVADAVVKLARHPRATTVIGMPETVLKLGQFANPLAAMLMNRFMKKWSKRAEPVRDTTGTMYTPPVAASGIHGGQRRAGGQRNTALAVGAAVVGVAIAARLLSRR
ncbi:SDR family oxidoreductase [Pseudoduganella umbonata]|uniref:SDR family oxidoreductase n=1 Tax=Pseudoduganella umbonata TaxID=864828 RepID=A0A4P8HRW5_9BURK|nr:SDR family oxidoreductase [Pseudoduganella umbonata]MBB3222361.1 short-subunit dehydrogenase [Pseudoduganella umbonata]QCP12577.1 SDR family oxidoreductase [Pseudoduganella umbonata]